MITKRHDIIKSFLMLIGVQEENAEKDCCLMEHDLTADTVDKLQKFLLFLKQDNQQDVIERFEKFLEKEE
ncbi:MAG: iron dependent repressor, metal binding and dimerization domain protein [Asgard group archaeon]|nr:iron dependent repressor, metal binding and dimerization domain protein [Asgard group archaeon]